MPWGIAAGVIGSALIGSRSSERAGEQAAAGQERAIELQREMYQQQREDYAPYREAGTTALERLMQMTGLSMPARPSQNAVPQPGQPVPAGRQGGRVPGTDPGQVQRMLAAEDLTQRGVPMWKANSIYDIKPVFEENPNDIVFRAYGGPVNEGQTFVGGEFGPEPVYNNQGNLVDIVGMNGPEMNTANQDLMVQPSKTAPPRGSGLPVAPISGSQPSAVSQPSYEDLLYGSRGDTIWNGNTPMTTGVSDMPAEQTVTYNAGTNGGGTNPEGFQLETDPGYQFRLSEGQRALEQSAAARGGLLSGATGRALQQYGQNVATSEFQNIYNRIANIAGLGQVGVQGSANAAGNFGAMGGQGMANIGSIQGAGTMGQYGALSQGIGNLGFLYGMNSSPQGGGQSVNTGTPYAGG